MLNNPLVSIIMPAYNAEKYIRSAIDSILDQSYSNFELLIADDASTDNSRTILEQYQDKRIKRFYNEQNIGVALTRNKLIKLSSGNLIALQDADDISFPTRIEEQVNAFLTQLKLTMCGVYADVFSKNEKILEHYSPPVEHDKILIGLKECPQFVCASIMFKKEVAEKLGGYREFFNRINAEDYDFTYRVAQEYFTTNIPKTLYKIRSNPHSLTRKANYLYRAFLYNHIIVQRLAIQRNENGMDSLQLNNIGVVEGWLKELDKPYKKDRSLYYREMAAKNLSVKLADNALVYALRAIIINPLKIINYRTLFYCLRKTFFYV